MENNLFETKMLTPIEMKDYMRKISRLQWAGLEFKYMVNYFKTMIYLLKINIYKKIIILFPHCTGLTFIEDPFFSLSRAWIFRPLPETFEKEWLLVVAVYMADFWGGELSLCFLPELHFIILISFFISGYPLVKGSFTMIWK